MPHTVHLVVVPGVEYCPDNECLEIDIGTFSGKHAGEIDVNAQDGVVLAIWRCFKKCFPHRPVRKLLVKGVR